jgi:membrane associated rhomboid family serine protease
MSCGGSGEIRESLQREVREKYTPRFADYTPMAGVSTALILINIAVYILTHATPEGRRALVYLVNDPQVMQTGEYWRFFTPMFLHANLMHLGFNCVFLLQFCPALEGVYGPRAFLGLYLFSGLLGDVVSWYGHDGWAGIGASGALFGVGTAYIGLHRRFGLFASHEINGWALYLGAFLLLGFGADALGSNALRIDNWGHLGGAIGGLAFTMLMPRPKGRE